MSIIPKYFFGDENEMNQDNQSTKILNLSEDVIHLSEPNLSSIPPSPSSSLASTKKLEWDSGADIGYCIYDSVKHHRKSKSYPSLNMDPPEKPPSTSKTKTKCKLSIIGEGDSLKSQKNKKPRSFKHSTPIDCNKRNMKGGSGDICLQTSIIQRSSKEVQTETVVDEVKDNEDKCLQTDLCDLLGTHSISSSEKSLKSSKFSESSKSDPSKHSSIKSSESSKHSRSSKSSESSNHTNCSNLTNCSNHTKSSNQSKSSKSGSFKYIPGSEFIASKSSNSTIKSSNTENTKSETDSGSSSSPLGKMISTQHSKNLIADIDKSLAILQKFIASKNYSNDTKKHYAKKIVTKIINNRYSEDTEDTESDFVPKSNKKEYVECGIQCDEIQKKSQIITEQSNCKIKESLAKLNALQTDLKNWRDAQTLSEKLFEARKLHSNKTSSSSSNDKRDYLVQHSKNERKRQVSWINNEISYLHKLKDLLQPNTNTNTNTNNSSQSTMSNASKLEKLELDENEIEKRFNQEFGPLTQPNKLSSYLSNEQIKLILDQDVHKNVTNNTSYNSHKNSIYGNGVKKKTQQTSSSELNPLISVEVATQYTPPPCQEANSESDDTNKASDSSESESKEIIQTNKRTLLTKGSTAYFLTFEEESQSEYDQSEHNNNNNNNKILEEVVVKIPKFRNRNASKRSVSANPKNPKNEACSKTLEEYLLRNRPNFVRDANWRWTQVTHRHQNLFTCHEMKEMSKRKYNNLPEIQEKVKNYKTLVDRQNNRFMANIFSKKLQKKTLQGHICLATCKNVMASE